MPPDCDSPEKKESQPKHATARVGGDSTSIDVAPKSIAFTAFVEGSKHVSQRYEGDDGYSYLVVMSPRGHENKSGSDPIEKIGWKFHETILHTIRHSPPQKKMEWVKLSTGRMVHVEAFRSAVRQKFNTWFVASGFSKDETEEAKKMVGNDVALSVAIVSKYPGPVSISLWRRKDKDLPVIHSDLCNCPSCKGST